MWKVSGLDPMKWIFIPYLIGIHWGWYEFQQKYVPENERRDHPFIRMYKKYMDDK